MKNVTKKEFKVSLYNSLTVYIVKNRVYVFNFITCDFSSHPNYQASQFKKFHKLPLKFAIEMIRLLRRFR